MSSYQLQNTPDWDNPTIQLVPIPGYYYVYGIGIPLMQINFLCSLYIVFRGLRRLIMTGNPPPQIRFPMYMAISDILLYVGHMNNEMYGVLWGHSRPDNIGCQTAAAFVTFGVFINMSITCSYVANIYLSVCREVYINTGSWDWKLISSCAVFAFIMAMISFPFSGPCYYWCYFKIDGVNLFAWLFTIVEVTLFNITLLCFYFIYRKVDSMTARTQGKVEKKNYLKKETVKKIRPYIIYFFCQWAGTIPYSIGHLFEYRPTWVFVLVNISINVGGILNAISFVANQGFSDVKQDSKSVSNETPTIKEPKDLVASTQVS
ncbi:hypothetical protein HDV06_001764 [Boothiomyces sp. JEL0866]|nr:hypothetical protein HDV06_001764 [Boothiomyces sp. JEL0866]